MMRAGFLGYTMAAIVNSVSANIAYIFQILELHRRPRTAVEYS